MDNVKLLLARELDEVHRITRDADGELRILFRMLHGVFQRFTGKDVDVDVMATIAEVAVKHADQIVDPLVLGLAQRLGNDGEGVGDTVLRMFVGQLRH